MWGVGKIICGFAGIGKSTMARTTAGAVDLESTPFQKDWSTYARVARHMRDNGYIVLLSCHKELRTHLHNNGIEYYVVLPNLENKEAFIQRYINRGNTEDFIRMLDENWESFCEELPWENATRVGEDYISEALPALETDINVGGKTDEWIPVERELPRPYVSVLVYMPEERPCPTVREGFLTNDGTWYAGYFTREPGEVVAWMPMPEPPEREKCHCGRYEKVVF